MDRILSENFFPGYAANAACVETCVAVRHRTTVAHAEGIHQLNGSRVRSGAHVEPRSLDDLSVLAADELAALYTAGKPPQLGVLAGPARGRLLAVPPLSTLPIVGGLVDFAVRAISRASWMPWRGKTFEPPTASHRTIGRNRFFSFEMLPFDAHVEKSALDHQETLVLKYDRPGNPWPVVLLKDELREVGRGVYLGPGYVRGPNGPIVLLWWACVKA